MTGIRKELTEDGPLDEQESKKFREIAARANYLSADRADIQFPAKEACRSMPQPRKSDWMKINRLARYLISHPEAILRFDGK